MKSDKNFHIEISFSYPDSRKRNSSAIMLREKFSFRKKINGAEYFSNLFFKLFISALELLGEIKRYFISLFTFAFRSEDNSFRSRIVRIVRLDLLIIQIDSDVRLLFVFT